MSLLLLDQTEECLDPLYQAPFKITKELFSPSEEFDFQKFVSEVNQYIKEGPRNAETVQDILGIFSIVRPTQQELLTKIENALSITHSSMDDNIKNKLDIDDSMSPAFAIIKNDDLKKLQEYVLSEANFDFKKEFDLPKYQYAVYLTDVAAYYGSVQCFKYLVLNDAPITEFTHKKAICGGNYEIIHYIENNSKSNNSLTEKCFQASIEYHRYAITDWLIQNHNLKITDPKSAISSFNFLAFSSYLNNEEGIEDDLDDTETEIPPNVGHLAAQAGNMPILICCVEKKHFNIEKKVFDIYSFSYEGTFLHYACIGGHMNAIRYLVEERGADINAQTYGMYKNVITDEGGGFTPLHAAAHYGHLEAVKYLCALGVNVEAKTNEANVSFSDGSEQCTPLAVACDGDHMDVVKYLCEEQKCDVNAKDGFFQTIAYRAVMHFNNMDIAEYLVECQHAKIENDNGSDSGEEEYQRYIKEKREKEKEKSDNASKSQN